MCCTWWLALPLFPQPCNCCCPRMLLCQSVCPAASTMAPFLLGAGRAARRSSRRQPAVRSGPQAARSQQLLHSIFWCANNLAGPRCETPRCQAARGKEEARTAHNQVDVAEGLGHGAGAGHGAHSLLALHLQQPRVLRRRMLEKAPGEEGQPRAGCRRPS